MGCGGSSSNSSNTAASAPNLIVYQDSYDFGSVTVGKTATLLVTVSNTGTASLSVDDLTMSDLVNFSIASGSCGSAPYNLDAGADCELELTFTPTEVNSFSETLVISSNDGDYSVTLTGEGTEATALTVNLNQIDTVGCPTIKAYVTVTDQNGFSVEGLGAEDFEITEDLGAASTPDTAVLAPTVSLSMAVAIVMDYSGSVVGDSVIVSAMENGAITFVDEMGADDQGEIIKFATTVGVIQAFTDDKDLLKAAIPGFPDLGTKTALYDAIYKGIEDAAATTANRRAVVLLTDGVDNGSSDVPGSIPGSVYTLEEVIDLAQAEGVPVFTIGAGSDFDSDALQDIADQTGGQFYEALTAERLLTVYTQLSEVLNGQYVLTYDTLLTGVGSDVVVDVEVPSQPGVIGDISDTMSYVRCP
jgi:VWFA-related protein